MDGAALMQLATTIGAGRNELEKDVLNEIRPKSYISWIAKNRESNIHNSATTFILENQEWNNVTYKRFVNRMLEIGELEDDWDNYGAQPPSKEIVNNTKSFLTALPYMVAEAIEEDDIFPNPNGTITLEWHRDSNMVSVEIGRDYANYIYRINSQYGGEEGIYEIAKQVPVSLIRTISKVIQE